MKKNNILCCLTLLSAFTPDATNFASLFYRQLSRAKPPPGWKAKEEEEEEEEEATALVD